jgi:hypothetical protein
MTLVVGNNCYCDIAEADELIDTRLMSTDKYRLFWDGLNDIDKTVIIMSSTEKYDKDSMEYLGYKVDEKQPLQWPRIIKGNIVDVPDKIKVGLLLQGIKEIVTSTTDEATLRDAGVKSFADGSGAKIEFIDGYDANCKHSSGIYDSIWALYFSDYTEIGKYFAI